MKTKLLSKKELLAKIASFKEKSGVDLSTEEDLSVAIMNLVSLEEHFFFTGEKTGKGKYFDLLREVREMRKALLARMVDKHEGETWCITKHLLAATMRLIEVGTKLYGDGKKEDGKAMFDRAYELYSLFWGLRLKLLSLKDLHKAADEEKPWTLKDILGKLADCCDE